MKELTGTGSEKYLKVWRPSMLALDSACGAPQGKINVYILKKKKIKINLYENSNSIAVRMKWKAFTRWCITDCSVRSNKSFYIFTLFLLTITAACACVQCVQRKENTHQNVQALF